MLYALVIFVFLFVVSLIFTVYYTVNANRLEVARRLQSIAINEANANIIDEEENKQKNKKERFSLIKLIGKIIPLEKYFENKRILLNKARLLIKPEELLGICLIMTIMSTFLMHIAFNNILLDALAIFFGFKIPIFYVKHVKKKRSKKLNDQLPEALNIISNGLRAGLSFIQAIIVAGKEMDDPIAEDFTKISHDNVLGKELEDILTDFADKEDSEDIEILVSAILIQRQVGGNLSEILDSISNTIRERVKLRGDIKTMTAQSKMSAAIIAAIPFLIIVVINIINRDFMKPLFTTILGNIMLGVAITMQIIGILVIINLLRVKA